MTETKKEITELSKFQMQTEQIFSYVANGWEVYKSVPEGNKIVILKLKCVNCDEFWPIDEKECFYCKAWYPHIIRCKKCNKIITEENKRKCPTCEEKNTTNCIGCEQGGSDEQFVPITFCQKCGSRQNKFDIRIIDLDEVT